MPSPTTRPVPDHLRHATAALDIHRAFCLTDEIGTTRTEVDAFHAHLVSLVHLLDTHAVRTRPLARAEADCLAAARTRLWQAADHLHSAFHTAPRTGSDREACRAGLPEGAPGLTICRRHQAAAALLRRRSTPADLHDPFTGLVRH